jgi:hypothetical protein
MKLLTRLRIWCKNVVRRDSLAQRIAGAGYQTMLRLQGGNRFETRTHHCARRPAHVRAGHPKAPKTRDWLPFVEAHGIFLAKRTAEYHTPSEYLATETSAFKQAGVRIYL